MPSHFVWHFLGAYIFSPQSRRRQQIDGKIPLRSRRWNKERSSGWRVTWAWTTVGSYTTEDSLSPQQWLPPVYPQVLTPARASKPHLPAGSGRGLSFQRMLIGPSLKGSCWDHHSCSELKRAALLLGQALAEFCSTSPLFWLLKSYGSSSKMFPDPWRGW